MGKRRREKKNRKWGSGVVGRENGKNRKGKNIEKVD